MDLLAEINTFYNELTEFSPLINRFIEDDALPPDMKSRASQLLGVLTEKVGYLGNEIVMLSGLSSTIRIEGKEVDIWSVALGIPISEFNEDGLGICIHSTHRALGRLKSDLKNGLRDEQGNLIKKVIELQERPPKVFISHGKGGDALEKLEKFILELGITPIVVKDQPNLDRTVDKKVEDCLGEADFVIIVATGDDELKSNPDIKQPRQNVIHEIGLAQQTHPGKIIYLLEKGTEFPSNIKPKVYESFARQSMDGAFIAIVRELRELGFLKVGSPIKTKGIT
jgi:predicted nucleotide-binding protein